MEMNKLEVTLLRYGYIIVPMLFFVLVLLIIMLFAAWYLMFCPVSCTDSGQYYYLLKNTI